MHVAGEEEIVSGEFDVDRGVVDDRLVEWGEHVEFKLDGPKVKGSLCARLHVFNHISTNHGLVLQRKMLGQPRVF